MTISCQTEAARLDALYKLQLLDTRPSKAFDRITRLAARIFGLEIAAISLTDSDRQWFKSRLGLEQNSIPRLKAPCAEVVDTGGALVIADLLEDHYFRHGALAASGVRYYAGAPLITADGHCLGALCVMGYERRHTTPEEVACLSDLAEMVMAQIELRHTAGRVDPLSGLPNRSQFIEDFQDMKNDCPPDELRLAVVVNLATPEQLGSAARVRSSSYLDELVTEASQWIRSQLGPGRQVYHVGDAQFALFAPPCTTLEEYLPVLKEKLARASSLAKSRHIATPTIGVAPFVLGGADCLDVLRTAQSAAHGAIFQSSRIAIYSRSDDDACQRRFRLLNEFGDALESSSQLRLVFQPRVDMESGACVGAEALLRWTHPELGNVSPGEFIPVIERSGLAQATTAWVLNAALRQQRAWRNAGMQLQLAVNVSAANLLEPDFVAQVEHYLNMYDLPPSCLELEITESAIMEHPERAHATLQAIAAIGVRLAIDDFGTGYSSLSYLQSMPADVVKIDQSFIIGLEDDVRKQSLVSTMISLTQDLGHRVVAEGVECGEVQTFLKLAGCDEAQGYLFARPLEPAGFLAWCGGGAAEAQAGRRLLRALA
ncbi:putative bifunctional diguanylate cyclase/phosphodiesterase [Pseudoduganella aquatica]|uniref:EAL domain-containing protein n=1 Tax=Pseudoduganella aquatica TaxID=2660641 RepID=A0A7X4HBR9_9BURK|nr:GGDEF and EAL domain-containing protein [Pseudoduganella aquatica]MYN07627.1 EAL domain-containing protein [Pseudoduganella aquatica]